MVSESGASDILILRVDNGGNILWSKYVDYGMDEFVGSVKVVDFEAQNIILTGYTGTTDTREKELIIVKLDVNGNLIADMRIRDGNMGFGLYGFDIVQTRGGDYIVAGTGIQNATESSPKYAFVMRVDSALNNIQWSKIYRSNIVTPPIPPGPTNYDSFNHILHIPEHADPNIGECFLLTGSGANVAGDQMMTNSLIDSTGLGRWAAPRGYRTTHNYPNSGVMALYSEIANKFYVAHPALEMITGILVLEGNSGTPSGVPQSQGFHNHAIGDYHNFVNGMVWADDSKARIVFSGYHFDQNMELGQAILFEIDVSGPTFINTWSKEYTDFFQVGNFMNVPMDFIVRPVNRAIGGSISNAIYYQPKALVQDNRNYRFVEPHEYTGDERFGVGFLLTDSNGDLEDGDCYVETQDDLQLKDIIPYANFGDVAYSFNIVGAGAMVSRAELSKTFICGSPEMQEGRFMGIDENDKSDNESIKIYPNPTTDYLTISGLSGIKDAKIVLYDMQGRTVLSKFRHAQPDNSVSLDVSALESGVYFVRISSEGKTVFVERVVKE